MLVLSGPLFSVLDDSLNKYNDVILQTFQKRWGNHKCDKPGCRSVIVFDGGMKASRKICGACKSGVKEFEHTDIKIVTGCTNHPGPGETMCKEHKGTETPALPASRLTKESLELLNKEHVNSDSDALHDTLFIIEEIRGKKIEDKQTYYQIKWEGYKSETWEPSKNIPTFIKNYYERTGRAKIPTP